MESRGVPCISISSSDSLMLSGSSPKHKLSREVWICMCVCCTWPCPWRGDQDIRCSVLSLFAFFTLKYVFSLTLSPGGNQQAPVMKWSWCLHPQMKCRGYRCRRLRLAIHVSSGDLNSGLHICVAGTLTHWTVSFSCVCVCSVCAHTRVCLWYGYMCMNVCMLLHMHLCAHAVMVRGGLLWSFSALSFEQIIWLSCWFA